MTSTDDPFLELRLYAVAPGRMDDMIQRVQVDLASLFPRHGVLPLAGWQQVAGPGAPLFIYLTPWRHMQERTRNWGGFYADPDWAEVRTRTNAGSELVQRYDILFLRAVVPWQDDARDRAPVPGMLDEMVIQDVAMGQTPMVREALLEGMVPAYHEAGAVVRGVFDVMSGRPLPSVVLFVRWPDAQTRIQAAAGLARRLAGWRAAAGAPLLERADHHLMHGVPVVWQLPEGGLRHEPAGKPYGRIPACAARGWPDE